MRQQRTCTTDGCDEPHLARGWCKRHYVQWQRTRPEHRAKEVEYDRKRRQTAHRRDAERERLRRNSGYYERQAEKLARRKQRRWDRALRKQARAAEGKIGKGRWYGATCQGCDALFVSRYASQTCSTLCTKRVSRRVQRRRVGGNTHRSRARRHGVRYESVDRFEVFKRDGYRCRICGKKTKGAWPEPASPSLDHIVPLSLGGAHALSNVQCACLACNLEKGNGSANDQLLLDLGG